MKTYNNLYCSLCSYENLYLAFKKARKRKTLKSYVIEFDKDLENNLLSLKHQLETFTYEPDPLTIFIVRDPKTRRISASHFRDRVVHHALCNIIEPILSKDFIYDSFANQKGKGTHLAIRRFEYFIRKICYGQRTGTGGQLTLLQESGKKEIRSYVLKADIRHYFDTINHEILLCLIKQKIRDPDVIWLIKLISENHKISIQGEGMPIGNLTSQFFANVYLNKLDQFVKHSLKIKYYIRYVDDFVVLHRDKAVLLKWQNEITLFLRKELRLEIHPEKSRIVPLKNGITFLGFRIFMDHRLPKKSNSHRIWKRLEKLKQEYKAKQITSEEAKISLEGWLTYARFANTYKLRRRVTERFDELFA